MSEQSIAEYTEKMRERYSRMRGKRARTRLLNEFVAVTRWERKHANKVLLGQKRKNGGRRGKRGAPEKYGGEVAQALKQCWLSMDQPCGKRMKDMLPLWVEHMDLGEDLKEELKRISASSIDRYLKAYKVDGGRKIRTPKPASAVKKLVEIRAENWATEEVGWTEVDTVAHCGGNMSGDFVWTLTSVEISSGWTEVRGVWNRGQKACLEGLESIQRSQPFKLLGIDSDNGGEFLNYHVYDWLKEKEIKQTRSRPYYKNDQAYVEQKNYTHVRQLLGYERIEHQELLGELNELLEKWSLWKNLFCVTMKQKSKVREGSRQKRTHEKRNLSPAQRLLESPSLEKSEKEKLEEQMSRLNPFEMRKEIQEQENNFWRKHQSIYEAEQEEEIALEGTSTLRSEEPTRAKKEEHPQMAMVSE